MNNPDFNKRICELCGKETKCTDVVRKTRSGKMYRILCDTCLPHHRPGEVCAPIAAMGSN